MLTRKIAVSLAAVVLVASVGVASAFADGSTQAPVVTAGDVQNGQEGVDELGAANDVAAAASDVQAEVESDAADDESGDQQDANDQSEEAGDNDQSDQAGDSAQGAEDSND